MKTETAFLKDFLREYGMELPFEAYCKVSSRIASLSAAHGPDECLAATTKTITMEVAESIYLRGDDLNRTIETMEKHYITNEAAVGIETQRVISDNGETGDRSCLLCIAKNADEDSRIIYITTNGDPVYVGSISNDGVVLDLNYDPDIIEFLDMEFDIDINEIEKTIE